MAAYYRILWKIMELEKFSEKYLEFQEILYFCNKSWNMVELKIKIMKNS